MGTILPMTDTISTITQFMSKAAPKMTAPRSSIKGIMAYPPPMVNIPIFTNVRKSVQYIPDYLYPMCKGTLYSGVFYDWKAVSLTFSTMMLGAWYTVWPN